MKSKRNLYAGLILFACSLLLIFVSDIRFFLFPSQEVSLNGGFQFEAVPKNYLFTQEFRVSKDYLSALDILMASSNAGLQNQNILVILDENLRPLFSEEFISRKNLKPEYLRFNFPSPLHVGKGNKINICIASETSSKENFLILVRKPSSFLGQLTIRSTVNNNVISTMKESREVFPYQGSLGIKTYEVNSLLNHSKLLMIILALGLSLVVIFWQHIRSVILSLNFVPENIFLFLSLSFGLLFVFITPPMQVPDENSHLNRAYQISRGNFWLYNESVPVSLIQLGDSSRRMNFNHFEKTSFSQTLSYKRIAIKPDSTKFFDLQHYLTAYFPQALGVSVGMLLKPLPLYLIYFGRIFNLLASILLVYLAIRFTPAGKWIFLLLGVMPMTMLLISSLSKDALIISLSFLFLSLIFRMAWKKNLPHGWKPLLLLILVAAFLASTRAIYLIFIPLYLVIPVSRSGSMKRYLSGFVLIVIISTLSAQIWSVRKFFKPASQKVAQYASLFWLPESLNEHSFVNLSNGKEDKTSIFKKALQKILFTTGGNSAKVDSIISDPGAYSGKVLKNFNRTMVSFYAETFVGKIGWLTRPLPAWLIIFYWLILIVASLMTAVEGIRISFLSKALFLLISLGSIVLHLTSLYITYTPADSKFIEGFTGRYFIPFAPLFFLLFYNHYIPEKLISLINGIKVKTLTAKKKVVFTTVGEKYKDLPLLLKQTGKLLLVIFAVISLTTTVYTLLSSFYIILV